MKIFEWIDDKISWLGELIASPFHLLIEWLETQIAAKITQSLEDFLEDFEAENMISLGPVIDEILLNPEIPAHYRTYLQDIRNPKHFALGGVGLAAAGICIIPILMAAGSGGIEKVGQQSLKQFRPGLLSPDEVIRAKWRGLLSSEAMAEELALLGYDEVHQSHLEAVRQYIPGVSDLIRFTVRDVFRAEVVERYGYDTDFDAIADELAPHLKAIGMDADTMRLYWRAHWQLPSISQAFEMMHRGKIELQDVRDLLRIADVAPAWIDPIIDVAFSPYTRVDVRRMYDAGVIGRDEVKKAYSDIGYDEQHAENLTVWTVSQSMGAEKDLSKSEILTAYKNGSLSRSDTLSALGDMGYDEEESALILAIQEYKAESSLADREKTILINQFGQGILSITDLKKKLEEMGLSERETSITVEEARSKVREKVAMPTKSDITKWLDQDIITQDEYTAKMRLLGYAQGDIDNYLKAM